MAAQYSAARRNSSSNTQLLDELEVLSQSLYQSHAPTARRTASLALPRSSLPQLISSAPPVSADDPKNDLYNQQNINPKPRTRRLSLSPWRSRSNDQPKQQQPPPQPSTTTNTNKFQDDPSSSDKKSGGLWNWKPIRALSHIAKQKMSCLFSVEVVSVQGLPSSMNGLRLSVCVRKKETKDGAVHTMPSRVSQGVADFEETLFIRCHVYCSPTGPGNALPKFEPRPFLIYVFAVDAHELDFGRSSVDLSRMIEESVQRNSEGTRVRQWDTSFNLSGKAKGGELVLKLGFQLMEKDGGIGIYSQSEEQKSVKPKNSSSSARQQSKASFSIPSPRLSSRPEASWTPSNTGTSADLQGIDDLNLDDPAPEPETIVQKQEEQETSNIEEVDFLDFDVEEKGVEFQDKASAAAVDSATDNEAQSEDNSDKRSVSSEVVKEVLQDQLHLNRLSELDSIAQQIKALESMMGDEKSLTLEEDVVEPAQRLEADEETVTREFLQMLEDEDDDRGFLQIDDHSPSLKKLHQYSGDGEGKVYLPDLGKGLGCVVQTKDGGYLSALNPLDIEMDRKDSPKLAIQTSKPLVVSSIGGFELFQRIAGLGFESLSSEIASLMPMDEITGKTAEQVAFEGLASAIIDGRSKEGASSTAARTIVAVKTMATAMNSGRSERISTGLWNVGEEPISIEEILAFSMQKIEAMTVEALKIQAEMSEEEAPFDVSPLKDNQALASAVPLEKWMTSNSSSSSSLTVTITVITQLRDPMRRYEAVGGPMIAFINAARVNDDGDKRFKIASLHVGGMKVKSRGGGGKRSSWDSEKQRLTSMQWLVAYGLGKRGKSGAGAGGGGSISKGQDLFWSLSSRVVADMWLKHIRNPDVKIINN